MRFLLIDAITSHDPGVSMNGIKNVTMSEDVFTHHFPRLPIMPGLLLVEAMVQLARWMIIAESGFETAGVLAGLQVAKFREFVVPGEQVEVLVTAAGDDAAPGCRSFRGSARVSGKDRAVASFALRQVPLSDLEDPQAARGAFGVLLRHGDPDRRL